MKGILITALAGVLLACGARVEAQPAPGRRLTPVEVRLAALVAELQRQTAIAANARAQRAQRPQLRPGEIAPGVRENIPMNPAFQTPAEKAWIQRSIAGMTLQMQVGSARSVCQQAQSYTPYNQFGQLQPGWYDTMTGPQRKACY